MTKKEINLLLREEAFLKIKETYISWLLFSKDYVYKIKKPVKFSYLDFSTLERRKYFLEKELNLNQRIAKEVYLKVVPVIREGRKIKILPSLNYLKENQRIIDYALKTKRIPERYYAPQLIKKGKLKKSSIDKIAKVAAQFHRKAETFSDFKKVNSLKIVKKNWQENFENLKDFVGKTIRKPIFKFIKIKIKRFLRENENLFQKRQEKGQVKDCHGDFHSGNIFITPSKIYIIDCIEFNKRFRIGDLASDVAFLTMDLNFLGQKDLADYFVKRYEFWSKNRNIWEVLDFYQCYYAFVRGKIESFSFKNSQSQREKERAERYFSLALNSALRLFKLKPFLIVIFGNIGTGKTSLAERLQELTDFSLLRSDLTRKEMFRVPVFSHREKAEFNQGIYNKKVTKKVYQELAKKSASLLRQGKSVILDATFSKAIFRKKIIALSKKLKIPYYFFECCLSRKIVFERLKLRKKKKEVSDADFLIYLRKRAEFEKCRLPKNHYFRINTKNSIDFEVDKVLRKILKN